MRTATPPEQHAGDFMSTLGVDYVPPSAQGFAVFPVLQFLTGRPWDDLALNAVHSLRPSQIRVTEDETKMNARLWRVTVYIRREPEPSALDQARPLLTDRTALEVADAMERARWFAFNKVPAVGIIERIEQEVEVGLRGCEHGHDLSTKLGVPE